MQSARCKCDCPQGRELAAEYDRISALPLGKDRDEQASHWLFLDLVGAA